VPLLNDGTPSSYGFGWGISEDEEGRKVVSHRGGWVGFRTHIVREIEERNLVVILSTGSHASFREIGEAIDAIVHDGGFEIPEPPSTWIVGRAMREEGVEAAVRRYGDRKRNDPDSAEFRLWRFDRLGRYYLEKAELEMAIAVFKLNVEAYPESARAYSSLGEAFVRAGDSDRGIEMFEKSIALDPDRTNRAYELLEEASH